MKIITNMFNPNEVKALENLINLKSEEMKENRKIKVLSNSQEYFIEYGDGVEENYYKLVCYKKELNKDNYFSPFTTSTLSFVLSNTYSNYPDIEGLEFVCLDNEKESIDDKEVKHLKQIISDENEFTIVLE